MDELWHSGDPSLPPSAVERIDRACDGFEAAWQTGVEPLIENYVEGVQEPERSTLLRYLLLLELDYRSTSGRAPIPHEYRRRFPGHVHIVDDVLKEAFPHELSTANRQQYDDTGESRDEQGVPIAALDKKEFGRFSLIATLGRGGYGTVYRARDPQLDREVALKVPRGGMLADEQDIQRFLREARAAAQLRHPNIVPVHEAGQAEGTYYIASEFIEGRTLRKRIERAWRPTFRETAILISKLAGALHYAHHKGIIHRDVKPENVIVDRSGEPLVMDFGLARRDEPDLLRTQEGIRMGTLPYMSPEQARGESHLADARSDLWSLGVVFYELLTGSRPFRGNASELLHAIQESEPEPPRKLEPSIPKDLETICLRCLAKDIERRYLSCQDLADELDRWLRGEPVRARTANAGERWVRWCRRNPAVAGLSATVVLLLFVIAAVTGVGYVRRSQGVAGAPRDETQAPSDQNGGTPPGSPDGTSKPPAPSIPTQKPLAPSIPAPPGAIKNSIGMTLARIPAGEFMMGSPEQQAGVAAEAIDAGRSGHASPDPGFPLPTWKSENGEGPPEAPPFWPVPMPGFMPGPFPGPMPAAPPPTKETPQHRVRITRPFYMGIYEVTQAQYERVMGKNPAPPRIPHQDTRHFPVENVAWEDAREFCRKLSALPDEKAAGRLYRLPTEAEWEYACRAGSKTRFFFGNDAASLSEYAWLIDNSERVTRPVGRKQPNAWGLHDMYGNVWEWCADWFQDDYYEKSPVNDPKGPASGISRVVRGGSMDTDASTCRSARRFCGPPEPWPSIGFRVVCE